MPADCPQSAAQRHFASLGMLATVSEEICVHAAVEGSAAVSTEVPSQMCALGGCHRSFASSSPTSIGTNKSWLRVSTALLLFVVAFCIFGDEGSDCHGCSTSYHQSAAANGGAALSPATASLACREGHSYYLSRSPFNSVTIFSASPPHHDVSPMPQPPTTTVIVYYAPSSSLCLQKGVGDKEVPLCAVAKHCYQFARATVALSRNSTSYSPTSTSSSSALSAFFPAFYSSFNVPTTDANAGELVSPNVHTAGHEVTTADAYVSSLMRGLVTSFSYSQTVSSFFTRQLRGATMATLSSLLAISQYFSSRLVVVGASPPNLFRDGIFRFAAAAAAGEVDVVTFGYLRMAGVDSPATLAGYYSAVEHANRNALVPSVRFQLNVTTVMCGTEEVCSALVAMCMEALTYGTVVNWNPLVSPTLFMTTTDAVMNFLTSMPRLTAVFKPNHLMAPPIVDYARELGGLPVIDPTTVRAQDFAQSASGDDAAATAGLLQFVASIGTDESKELVAEFLAVPRPTPPSSTTAGLSSDHILHFRQYVRGAIGHAFTLMQQAGGCAYSGVLYEPFSEVEGHLPYVKILFAIGGLPEPTFLDVTTTYADEEALLSFFSGNGTGGATRRRECYLVLTTHSTFRVVLTRLAASLGRVDPSSVSFFGTAMMASDTFTLDPTWLTRLNVTVTPDGKGPREISEVAAVEAFSTTHFLQWHPPYNPSLPGSAGAAARDLQTAFSRFTAAFRSAEQALSGGGGGGPPPNPNSPANSPTYSGAAHYSSTPLMDAFDLDLEPVPATITNSAYEAFMSTLLVVYSARAAAARLALGVTVTDSATVAPAPTTAPSTAPPATADPSIPTVLPPPALVVAHTAVE